MAYNFALNKAKILLHIEIMKSLKCRKLVAEYHLSTQINLKQLSNLKY